MKRKDLIDNLKPFVEKLYALEIRRGQEIIKLEKEMNKAVNRKDLEFFYCDGNFAGIGNIDKSMPLIDEYLFLKTKEK
jgi:hypothetical protein